MAEIEEASVSETMDDGTVTITGGGSLTFMNATEFGEKLKQASLTADAVIVDMRSVQFIDTQIVQDLGRAGITLIGRKKRLRVLVSETTYPRRVMKISGYDTIMDIEVE